MKPAFPPTADKFAIYTTLPFSICHSAQWLNYLGDYYVALRVKQQFGFSLGLIAGFQEARGLSHFYVPGEMVLQTRGVAEEGFRCRVDW